MAIEKEIKIKVDKGNSDEELKKTKNNLKEVDDSAKQIGKSTSSVFNSLDKYTGGAISKFRNFKTSLSAISKGFKGVGAAITASGIGLLILTITSIVKAFKSSEEGQNKFAKLMGVIGSVLGNVTDAISDLGEIIIGVLSGNSEAIKSASEFGKKIWDVVGLPIKTIIDIVKTAGRVLSNLFSGDIDGALNSLGEGVSDVKENFVEAGQAIEDARKSLKGFSVEALREAKIASQIADQRAKADKIERSLIVEKAEAERKIAELRDIATRRDLYNLNQRKEALIEASKINDEITKKEINSAILRRDAIIEENKLSKSNKEALKLEEEAKAKVIQLETQRLNLQKRLGAELSSINQQQKLKEQSDYKERKELIEKQTKEEEEARQKKLKLEKDRLKKLSDFERELIRQNEDYKAKEEEDKLKLQRERAQEELDNLIASEEEKRNAQIILNEYYDSLELELEEKKEKEKKEKREKDLKEEEKRLNKELELKKSVEKAKLNIAGNTLDLLGGILKEGSDLAKGVAVAQATISGIEGVQNAFTTAAKNPITTLFPGFPFLQAGLAGAFSALQIQKILSTDSSGSSSGSSQSSSPSLTAPSFNLVAGTPENQISESIQQQNERPIQAFVVGKSVTSQQEMDRNIESAATI